MFNEIYINNFTNFQDFKMEFANVSEEKLNINLLVGKNGSGKSCFLDALFQIALSNLKKNVAEGYTEDTKSTFEYSIKKDSIIVSSNRIDGDDYKISGMWDKVVRFYSGSTKRTHNLLNDYVLDINMTDSKWCFIAYVLSGKWKQDKTNRLWDLAYKLVLGNKDKKRTSNKMVPKIIWIETSYPFNKLIADEDGDVLNPFEEFLSDLWIGAPDYTLPSPKNLLNENQLLRHYWIIEKDIPRLSQPNFSTQILTKMIKYSKDNSTNLRLNDCGFIYTYSDSEELIPDQLLSDGEHAFFNRFSLLMILRESADKNPKEKYLVLLDEPETHFNEYWKTYFLYLVSQSLENTMHDVFIATHSAMLVTDAKPEEVHRLELRSSGVYAFPTPINTYGVNVVDIGRTLFQMESDIGHRAQDDIKKAIESNDPDKLEKMLKIVGPGEWRWKIRTALNNINRSKTCVNYVLKKNDEDSKTADN